MSFRQFFTHLLQSFLEYLLIFPLYLIFSFYVIEQDLFIYWLINIFILYIIGNFYRSLFHKQHWFFYGLIAFLIGSSVSLIFSENWLIRILLSVFHFVFIYRGMMYAAQSRQKLLPIPFLWIAGPVNYLVCFLFYYNIDDLNQFLPIFSAAGFITVSAILFIVNSDHLRAATLSKEEKPFISRQIKRQNYLFLTLTLILIFLIAGLDLFRKVFWGVLNSIRFIIQWIFSDRSEEVIEDPQEAPPESPALPPELEGGEPSKIAVILEYVAIVFTYAFLAVVLIMFILFLFRRTRRLIIQVVEKFVEFLKRLGGQLFLKGEDPTEYTDEKENIFNWEEWRKERQDRFASFVQNIFSREPKWDDLSNEEKVRFVYQNFLQKNQLKYYMPSLTAREILEEMKKKIEKEDESVLLTLRDAYEKSRYGEKEISNQTVEDLYSLIQRK